MRDKVEQLIIDWLKSDNENTTYLADQICVLLNVISSVCICNVEKRRQFEVDMNQCRYCEKQIKQTDL